MSNSINHATSPAGTDNSITPASAPNGKPSIPTEGEHAAASRGGDARTSPTGDGGANWRPETSGSTASQVKAAEIKSKTECYELLSRAVADATILATYLSRNGMSVKRDGKDVTPEVLQAITDASEKFEKENRLNGQDEAAFLEHYRDLAAAALPVTVASLRDSMVGEKVALPRWLFSGRKVTYIPARVATLKYSVIALIALFLLVAAQSYYASGTNYIQLLPEYRLLEEQEQIVLKGVTSQKEPVGQSQNQPAGQPKTPEDSRITGLLDADRTLLCKWLARCPLIGTPTKPGTNLNAAESTNAVIVKGRQVLGVFQGYLLPLLYGLTGAAAYVVRTLALETRERLYRRENGSAYALRLFLGALAGLAIGWFLKPEAVSGFNAISPFALAFVAGYSVDLLFTLLDKIVNTFSAPQNVPPPKAP